MQTSYFARYKEPNGVSIAGGCPDWFQGRQYKKLAPKYWFFAQYKEMLKKIEDGHFKPSLETFARETAELNYIAHYQEEVLDKLDAQQVYEELGENAVLLCWETPDKFCHRHLVASWLETKLGILVPEYTWE